MGRSNVTRRKRAGQNPGCAIAFFVLWLVLSLVVCFFAFGVPAWRSFQARTWKVVPCTILDSRVESRASDDGTTYRPAIRYEYSWEGRRREGSRYQFSEMSYGNRKHAEAVVARYPAGRGVTCFVDPGDPSAAVLERGLDVPLSAYLITGLFPLVGVVGLAVSVRARRKAAWSSKGKRVPRRRRRSSRASGEGQLRSRRVEPAEAGAPRSGRGPLRLRTSQTRKGAFAFLLFFAIAWNGFVGYWIFGELIPEAQSRGVSWFHVVFATPFVLGGLAVILLVVYQFLALLNPRPLVEIRDAPLRMGSTARVSWEFTGSAHRIQSLTLRLQGQERATYQAGTDTVTDRHVFHDEEIFSSDDFHAFQRGEADLTLPRGSMPSFRSRHNQILWVIQLHGIVRNWPDVKHDFALHVRPAEEEDSP